MFKYYWCKKCLQVPAGEERQWKHIREKEGDEKPDLADRGNSLWKAASDASQRLLYQTITSL